MTREIAINGCPVKVQVRRADVERVIADCAHDPDAVHAYAQAQAEHLPGRMATHTSRVQLQYSYARQAFAAEEADRQLAAEGERAA